MGLSVRISESTSNPLHDIGPFIEFYENFFAGYRPVAEDLARREIVARFSPCGPDSLGLEIGAGGGFLTEMLGRRLRLVALDLKRYADMAAVLDRNSSVSFVAGTALNLPFRSAIFDFIVFSEVIEHIPKSLRTAVLNEISRVLKKGGRVLITTPNPCSLAARVRRVASRVRNPGAHHGSQILEEWLSPSDLDTLLLHRFVPITFLSFYAELPVLHRWLGSLATRLNAAHTAKPHKSFLRFIFLYHGVVAAKSAQASTCLLRPNLERP